MNYKFLDALEVSPVIAAVKDDEGVDACLKSESQVVFIWRHLYNSGDCF